MEKFPRPNPETPTPQEPIIEPSKDLAPLIAGIEKEHGSEFEEDGEDEEARAAARAEYKEQLGKLIEQFEEEGK